MTPANALGLLGFVFTRDTKVSVADVRSAYARRVKECHPDTSGVLAGLYSMTELQEARDLLLEALESQKYACKLCRGVGKVRSGMGWRQCGACGGKGETR